MYAGIYRAKAVSVTAGQAPTLTAYVPQVFGDTPVTITDFMGGIPTAGMGWVFFQNGNPEFPVWAGVGIVTEPPPDGGGGEDEVWIGPDTPPGDHELWYDTNAPGPPSGGAQAYTHVQAVPAAVWVITHPLDFYPNVVVVDSAGDQVEGDVVYTSATVVTVSFRGAFSGTAYLS